jgi:hypothetical protein
MSPSATSVGEPSAGDASSPEPDGKAPELTSFF